MWTIRLAPTVNDSEAQDLFAVSVPATVESLAPTVNDSEAQDLFAVSVPATAESLSFFKVPPFS